MIIFLIKQKRIEKNLSLTKLSKLSGVSKSFLSEIESEIKKPSVETLCYLARALKCEVIELYKFSP